MARVLSKGDPSIAFAYNMHQAMVGIFRNSPALSEQTRASLMSSVGRDRAILCGPFSEARAGLSGLADTVAVPQPEGGWRITGHKNWSTLVLGSDIIALNATITDADGSVPEDFQSRARREATLIVIPTTSPNLAVDPTWDTMCMRATANRTIVMDGVPAAPEMHAGNFRRGPSRRSRVRRVREPKLSSSSTSRSSRVGRGRRRRPPRAWTRGAARHALGARAGRCGTCWSRAAVASSAAMGFAPVYLGLADKAFEEAAAILKTKHLGATTSAQDTAVAQVGYVQYVLGEMRAEIEVASRVLEATGQIAVDGRYEEWPLASRKAR